MKLNADQRNHSITADPTVAKQTKVGENMIKQANGGIQGQLGEIVVPGSKAELNSQMLGDYYDNISKGLKPQDAANKVLKSTYGDIAATRFIAPKYLPISVQGDYDTLNAQGPVIKKISDQLKAAGDSKSMAERLNILKTYNDRLQALGHLKKGQ